MAPFSRYVPFQPTSVNIMLPRLLNTLRYTSRIITDTLHIQFSWKRERGPSMCAVDKVRADRCIVFSFATVLQSGPPNSVHSVASIACANSNVNTLNPIPCWHSIRFFLGNPHPYLPVILLAMKFRLEGPVDHGVGSSWHSLAAQLEKNKYQLPSHLLRFLVARLCGKEVREGCSRDVKRECCKIMIWWLNRLRPCVAWHFSVGLSWNTNHYVSLVMLPKVPNLIARSGGAQYRPNQT